nr:retrovirus-related Pol polyprotein from transposon TNT 1-94 [Tanacetum cinerariifolium]
MPIDNINNTTTKNVGQNVVDENLPQLFDSRGGSHVTNVPEFDKKDFSSWKDRFLVYLKCPEPYLLDNDFDVEEDQRSSNEFLADLNAEFHKRALLANLKRFYKRITYVKAFIAIVVDELFVGRADARSDQWVEITKKKALGGKGMRKEKVSSKEIIFNKSDVSSSKTILEVTSDFESECDTQRPLPPLPKIIGEEPFGYGPTMLSMCHSDESDNRGYYSLGPVNSVLFTDTECVVLSSDFKLPDENHVLLRVPRENNMYNVDLKNFCGVIRIKREFSIARTPQQNKVAERKNRTLIEAARAMLADSLLPIPFSAEAVNTACYVQNRVLVTKPHNKTPYELLLNRTPSIGFMRPFRRLVIILNTLDPLRKFDGKANEGFLIRYFVNIKAFRAFNIVAGNQPNHNAGIQGNSDASNVVKEVVSTQQYVLLPLWSTSSKDPQNTDADAAFDVKDNENKVYVSPRVRDLRDEFKEFSVNSTNMVSAASAPVIVFGPNPTNSTNSFNVASPFNNVTCLHWKILFIQLMKKMLLQRLTSLTPQTKSMARMVKEQGGLNQINDEDFHTCMFACFLSQEEPKKVHQVLKDPSWIKAMQEELLQFKMQKVWVLVDLPKGFEDPDYSDKVYKVVRALYGLHQAPRAEDTFQQDLRLDNANGVACLPNEDIFAELARMGYEKPPPKLTFYKAFFSAQCMVRNVDSPSKFLMYPQFLQVMINAQVDDISSHTTKYTPLALTQKVFANIRRIGKGFSGYNKVANLKQDKIAQALEIVKLKQKVKRLEKKKRSKHSSLKRLRKVGRMEEDATAIKEINAAEPKPTVFDDLEMQEKHLDNIKKFQNLKRKPISIAQARKNMIIYLKNMVGYKIAHFKGMTYDHVRAIFEREYNKVQTFLKPDRDEEPAKKRGAKETLLKENFKKLREEVKASGSRPTQDTPTDDPKEISKEDVKNMLQIVQSAELKGRSGCSVEINKKMFNTAMPIKDKEKALLIEFKRLVQQVSSTRRHDIFIFLEKDYPLTDAVLLLMLSTKLQVDKDCEMARDLVMKIFMEANKP